MSCEHSRPSPQAAPSSKLTDPSNNADLLPSQKEAIWKKQAEDERLCRLKEQVALENLPQTFNNTVAGSLEKRKSTTDDEEQKSSSESSAESDLAIGGNSKSKKQSNAKHARIAEEEPDEPEVVAVGSEDDDIVMVSKPVKARGSDAAHFFESPYRVVGQPKPQHKCKSCLNNFLAEISTLRRHLGLKHEVRICEALAQRACSGLTQTGPKQTQ
ncbi:hypothetical protein GG344DRAFT_70220 [Lentinula edodes]|nr:hypothetical protein GG344DRAFT_70220 [Lentinula edodes]